MARPPIIVRDDMMRQRVINLLSGLDLAKPWSVTVEPYRKKRTLSQNALYWKWVNEVVGYVREATGMDADEIHEFLKAKFLPPRVIEINGQVAEYRTTTKLSTAEMTAFMDAVYVWATSELGLLLPLPVELGREAA